MTDRTAKTSALLLTTAFMMLGKLNVLLLVRVQRLENRLQTAYKEILVA